jgi:quinol-cytochrome oxidoreductase complex cytochrome b subunit
MVIHLWGKFFMAAWRGKRTLTWVTGVLCFVISIATAFTGYLSQQNFDSQWIATQAKDGLNSVGVGAFFDVMNFGQMLLWHILLLPVGVAALVGLHLLMVRRRGVVRPFPLEERGATASVTAGVGSRSGGAHPNGSSEGR